MKFTAEIREGLLIALDAIRVNKLRAGLTTLGAMWLSARQARYS